MNGLDVMGLVYSNSYDKCLPELASLRAMGSVPFGGRYRLIDFQLSNMVNSGITKIGVITNNKYRSLLDHVGQGKAWDLSRKNSGLSFLPPFDGFNGNNGSRLSSLIANKTYISDAKEKYVVLADCNVVFNTDISKIVDFHIANKADITFGYVKAPVPQLENKLALTLRADGTVAEIRRCPNTDAVLNSTIGLSVMSRALLESILNEAEELDESSLERDVFMAKCGILKMYGYEITDFVGTIANVEDYYKINMQLLEKSVRDDVFNADRPVLTKVHDDCPTMYKQGSTVADSLICDGCYIAGTVENCVISRGVVIEEGAVVKNSILLQGSLIKKGSTLNCVILDKNVTVGVGRNLSGAPDYPFFVGKGIKI